MNVLRAEKQTRNADDLKVLLVGIVCAIVILMSSLILPRLTEYRWYRDLTKLTPFYGVELLYSEVQGRTLFVGGQLNKRRCVYEGLVGYISGSDGIRRRVKINDKLEANAGGSTNRPPSDAPESWGPWKIDLDNNPNIPDNFVPVDFEIYAEHVECPTPPVEQRNKFIDGDWGDYLFITETEAEVVTEADEVDIP